MHSEEKEDSELVERQYPYKHIVATFFDCEADLLDKEAFLKTSLLAIDKANMTLVNVPRNPLVYKVDEDAMGGGVSVNALITTSHLTIHSSRDYSSVEFDCATCGPESRPQEAFTIFERFLKPKEVKIWFKKGIADCINKTLETDRLGQGHYFAWLDSFSARKRTIASTTCHTS